MLSARLAEGGNRNTSGSKVILVFSETRKNPGHNMTKHVCIRPIVVISYIALASLAAWRPFGSCPEE